MSDNYLTPLYSPEAESYVLGSMLLDENVIHDLLLVVEDKDFFNFENREIFKTIIKVFNNSDLDVDIFTVSDNAHPDKKEIVNLGYLSSLAKNTPVSSHVLSYAKIVKKYALCRETVSVGNKMVEMAYDYDFDDPLDLLGEIEKLFSTLNGEISDQDDCIFGMSDILASGLDVFERGIEGGGVVTGVPTGFTDLDNLTTGLNGGDLIVIAGRPSMGKSTLAMNIGQHAAFREKLNVLFFTLEMPVSQLGMRLMCSEANINIEDFKKGKVSPSDQKHMINEVTVLQNTSFYMFHGSGPSVNKIRSEVLRHIRKTGGIDIVIIDYIGLMKMNSDNGKSKADSVAEITRALKCLAIELDIPIVALSQLNRSLESRPSKRPVMSDLRDSGAIEQDADIVMFVYRDEVYNKDDPALKGLAEVIVAKQRNGPLGDVGLYFLGEKGKFTNRVNPHNSY